MKVSFLFYIALISAFMTSRSTQCNGLMRKLNSESQLSLTCRRTSNFGLCAYTLGTDPRSKGANVNGLAQIALDKLAAQVRVTSSHLQRLKAGVVGREAHVVDTCIRIYTSLAKNDVVAAMTSLNGKVYGVSKQAVQAAVNGGRGCQQEVDQNPSPKWQMLTAMNTLTQDLSRLSSDLIGLLR